MDMKLLKSMLPLDDYDFFPCGPPPFVKALYEGLVGIGIGEDRIHYESLGPAMVLKPDGQVDLGPGSAAVDGPDGDHRGRVDVEGLPGGVIAIDAGSHTSAEVSHQIGLAV